MRRSQELGLSYTTIWRILHLDKHIHPYKVQLTQQLKPAAEHSQCRRYALNNRRCTAIFRTKFFSAMKHENYRIWSSENPEKVTVWCALFSDVVIRPYFFENDDGTTVTVNS